MARVEWTRTDPNDIEAVVAVLLCREHLHAVRIRPSQGDGGIDVLAQIDDGLIVYQVKGFTENIEASEKRQIKDSYERFLAYRPRLNLPVARWHVVTPRNPTKEQLAWLNELTEGADFECSWRGLDFVDGLAAKYPDVIDYYLRDGKERLQSTIAQYLRFLGSEELREPQGFEQRIDAVHNALNKFDPHYDYDFAVETVTPERPARDISKERGPRLVAVSQVVHGGRSVTFWIHAKFDEALKERPVPGSFTLQAEAGSPEAQMIEDWVKFGTPLVNAPAVNVRFDLPGGFGGQAPSTSLISVAQHPSGAPPVEMTVRILEPDNSIANELDFETIEATQGLDGLGMRAIGRDVVTGTMGYELRSRLGELTNVATLSSAPFTGTIPADALKVLRFAGSVVPPRRIQLALRGGPAFGPPTDVPRPLVDPSALELVTDVLSNLITIQQHTFERILVPDLSKKTMEELLEWSEVARLLRGEDLESSWSQLKLCMNADATIPEVGGHGLLTQQLTVEIDGHELALGWMVLDLRTIQMDPSRSPAAHEDHWDCWIIPVADDTAIRRFVGKEEPKLGLGDDASPASPASAA